MSSEENKAIVVRHFKEVHEHGRVELIDSYYAPDGSTPGMIPTPELFREWVLWLCRVSKDLKITVLDMIAEGDKVMAYIHVEITYPSKYAPEFAVPYPPLDQPVTWSGLELYRIADGKMLSRINYYDIEGVVIPEQKVA